MNDTQPLPETVPVAPAQHQEVFQSGNFGDLLNTMISRKLDEAERKELSAIAGNYEKALNEARKNNLEISGFHLDEAGSAHAEIPENSLLARLLDLHALPVQAYYYYKNYQYKLAEDLLMKSIADCSWLIEQGFFMVECHRVQQLHNLARMYFKRKEFDRASWIIGQALQYLVQEVTPELGSGWSADALRQTPYSLRSDMILQLALETAGELLPPTPQREALHQLTFGNWPRVMPGPFACEPLSRWILLKDELLSGMSEELFVASAIDFIVTTPAQFDILKLGLMVSVTDILRKTADYDATVFENLVSYGKRLRVSQKHKLACFTYIEP